MILLYVTLLGTLTAAGVWLLLRARSFDTVLGLTLLGYAVNLFIFAMGRLKVDAAPFVGASANASLAAPLQTLSDPLPQALVLTAIVIGFAMTALLLALAVRVRVETGSDHVDGDDA